ncbi:MAG: efflux RND transporter periplasmic adaptor subunit [Xanthobacteraceae bacterium]
MEPPSPTKAEIKPHVPARWINARAAWILAAVLALAAIGLVGWWNFVRTKAPHYTTVTVGRGSITRSVIATGTVNPVLTIIVGTYVSGIIQDLFCDYNTQVRPGQVCARIDPRPYQATLDQYSAQLLRDQAIRDKDKADLTRYQTLAAQNAINRQQAEDQVFVVAQDEATVKLDQALVDGARLNLLYTDIVSPVNGVVVSRSVTAGQTVAASFQTPTLFLIATDLKQMQVDTNSSEGDMEGIKVGEQATFTVDAYPKQVFKGTVNQIRQSPQTVQNVVTYDVVLGVDNSSLELLPGMTAATQIVADQRADVLRVPNQALRYLPVGVAATPSGTPGRQPRVWVLRDGKPAEVHVTVGLADDNFTEIVSGDLKAGDQAITAETHPK